MYFYIGAMTFSVMFNPLFLVYAALFSASLFALISPFLRSILGRCPAGFRRVCHRGLVSCLSPG
jgi:hypothetical protein